MSEDYIYGNIPQNVRISPFVNEGKIPQVVGISPSIKNE
jgi:hypothetical protein